MPLREHLRELRTRLIKSTLAVGAGGILGWFIYLPLIEALQRPFEKISQENGTLAKLNFADVASPFNLRLKIALYVGLVIASPVWLWQLWAFIVPGLTRKEKRYALGFVAVAFPLFLSGIGLAWMVLPNAIRFFSDLTPRGSAQLISADTYLTFVTRLMLAFGFAFLVPLLLVALNLLGVVRAQALLRSWRVAVFLCFLFAAVASPSPDAGSMIALAMPMVGLYFAAVGVAWLVDRRRDTRRAADPLAGLSDDQASTVEAATPLDRLPDDFDDGMGPPR
ncbi:MAG TPA: twin-arginine translocase subunit TatC [Kineosporiaceae bacterium]|nr:twin-arginine translocase subunit TatC [Kineosporiaceae bacterium]